MKAQISIYNHGILLRGPMTPSDAAAFFEFSGKIGFDFLDTVIPAAFGTRWHDHEKVTFATRVMGEEGANNFLRELGLPRDAYDAEVAKLGDTIAFTMTSDNAVPVEEDWVEIVIPAMAEHAGIQAIRAKVPWRCLICGERRGEPFNIRSYDGSRSMIVTGWTNPCGHVEKYNIVREHIASLITGTVQEEIGG